MFGRKRKLQRLAAALAAAESGAESQDRNVIGGLLGELRSAWADSPSNDMDLRAQEVINVLERRARVKEEPKESTLRPCPDCGSQSLLVSGAAAIHRLYIDNGGLHFPFRIIVCADCGDAVCHRRPCQSCRRRERRRRESLPCRGAPFERNWSLPLMSRGGRSSMETKDARARTMPGGGIS